MDMRVERCILERADDVVATGGRQAVDVAVTFTAPAASTTLSKMNAVAFEGFAPLKASESAGSPIRLSMILKRRFCGFQPTELKARVMPMAVPPDVVAFSVVAVSTA